MKLKLSNQFMQITVYPRGLYRVWSWTARTLGLWVRVPLKGRMNVPNFLCCSGLCR